MAGFGKYNIVLLRYQIIQGNLNITMTRKFDLYLLNLHTILHAETLTKANTLKTKLS